MNDGNNANDILVANEESGEYCEGNNNARRRRRERKTKSLSNVLQKLNSMAQSDKAKVIRKRFEVSNIGMQ